MDKSNKRNDNRIFVVMIIIVVAIIGGGIVADSIVANKTKNMGKNVDYYEETGGFEEYKIRNSILEKYKFTGSEYNTFKELASRAKTEIKNNNITEADIYFRKKIEDNLGGEYIVIRSNGTYITVSQDEIKKQQYNDKRVLREGTIGEYYDDIFSKAKKDSEYKELIYFSNIKEFKNTIE